MFRMIRQVNNFQIISIIIVSPKIYFTIIISIIIPIMSKINFNNKNKLIKIFKNKMNLFSIFIIKLNILKIGKTTFKN